MSRQPHAIFSGRRPHGFRRRPVDVEAARQAGVEAARFEHQHDHHEARRRQSEAAAGIEAEIETLGVERGAEADIARPGDQDDQHPEVERRVRPSPPYRHDGKHAEHPDGQDHREHGRRVGVVGQQKRRQQAVTDRCQQRDGRHDRNRRGGGPQGGGERRGKRRVVLFGEAVGDHQQRKSGVPQHVQPDRGLRSRSHQAARGEQSRERQGVRHDGDRGEQIGRGEQQQRARALDRELAEQDGGGNGVAHEQRGLVDRNEAQDRRERRPWRTAQARRKSRPTLRPSPRQAGDPPSAAAGATGRRSYDFVVPHHLKLSSWPQHPRYFTKSSPRL